MDEMKRKRLYTDKDIRIAFDPYRSRIIEVFFIHKGIPMTAKQVADYMGEHPSKVNYHIQKLVSIDIIRLDHTESINGITAKFYIIPYDTIGMVRTNVSKNVSHEAIKNINESNYTVFSKWFEKDIEKGRQVYQEMNSVDDFCLLSNYVPVYMTKEEFNDSVKKINEVLLPYIKDKPGSDEYKVLMATVKTRFGENKE